MRRLIGVVAVSLIGAGALYASVGAMQFSSTDYLIDTATLNNVGGYSSSSDYQLTSSGGESAIGNGASGSYMMPAGHVAQLGSMISVKTEPANLLGYWPMDAGSGSEVYDNSTYTNDGALQNSPTWVSGKIGNAVSFNGSSQYALVGDGSQFQLTAGTIEFWMKSTATSGTSLAVTKAGAWAVGVSGGKADIFDWTSGVTCTGATSVADGVWHHVAATLQSGVTNGSILYVDGVQDAKCTWTPQAQTGLVYFAANNTAPIQKNFYNGTLDQVKIFNRAFSSAEVSAEYSAQNAGSETGLTLQTIIPGASNTSPFSVITQSTAGGYNLAINEDHDLQQGGNTIPAISGNIGSPIAWNEGTTKGLGFTLTSTNATAISASWNGGAAYAALPTSATTMYTRSGQQGTRDILNLQLRADVPPSLPSGAYTNTMTITGTTNP